MKNRKFKKCLVATILSLCLIISIIPAVAAKSDTSVESTYTYDIYSAYDLYNAIGGNATATLDENKVTLNNDVYSSNNIRILGGNITLDLDGHELIGNDTSSLITILSGNVEINDSSFGSLSCQGFAINLMSGNLVINGAKIYGINANGGNLVINSGKILNKSDVALKIGYNSSVVLNDGIISSKIYAVQIGEAYSIGTLTVNGGSIYSEEADGILVTNGNLTVNDGNIKGKGNSNYYQSYAGITAYNTSTVKIAGGEISGGYTALKLYSNDASISGGTFLGDENAIVCNNNIKQVLEEGRKVVDRDGNDIDVSEATCIKGFAKVI